MHKLIHSFFLISLIALELNSLDYNPNKFWKDYFVSNSTIENNDQRPYRNFFKQWFTGPLITPSPITLPPKHPAVGIGVAEYYFYGGYNQNGKIETKNHVKYWSTQYILYPQFGITNVLGTEGFITFASNYSKKHKYSQFEDLVYRFGFQLLTDKLKKGSWTPDLRLILEEIFPIGKYHKLRTEYEGIDNLGQGSFQTGVYLAWQKGFKYNTNHAFNLAGAYGYFLLSSVKVKGVNFYGGTPSSRGIVYPGNMISIFSSGEFEITKHIALAYDSNLRINLSGKYKNARGTSKNVDPKQFVSFNFTPELEITISENAGFLMGPWVSIAGQNSPAFASFFIVFLYVF